MDTGIIHAIAQAMPDRFITIKLGEKFEIVIHPDSCQRWGYPLGAQSENLEAGKLKLPTDIELKQTTEKFEIMEKAANIWIGENPPEDLESTDDYYMRYILGIQREKSNPGVVIKACFESFAINKTQITALVCSQNIWITNSGAPIDAKVLLIRWIRSNMSRYLGLTSEYSYGAYVEYMPNGGTGLDIGWFEKFARKSGFVLLTDKTWLRT